MTMRVVAGWAWLVVLAVGVARGDSTVKPVPKPGALLVTPSAFTIYGDDNAQQLVVTSERADGVTLDHTREVVYSSANPTVATVSSAGLVTPRGNGTAEIRATFAGGTTSAVATVKEFGDSRLISFRNQIVPIFSKYGCNSGGCHGKATGQNGFKLSLLGFDAPFDHAAVVKEGRGRRVFPAAPQRSLLLLKATATVPHGGGQRIKPASPEYALLLKWIEQGTPQGSADDPFLERIECYPQANVLDRDAHQQMIVTAHYSDGRARDISREAQFKSNETHIANVDDQGLVTTEEGTGDTAVMARYLGHVDVYRLTVPLVATHDGWPPLPSGNAVDQFVRAKWHQLKLVPSPLADDATFLRRAFIDAIGTLPTPAEVREFLADQDPRKREKWVDRILARNEYADFWAIKWGDLLRNKRRNGKEAQRGTFAFHAWIRNAFATNMPYDRFVRGIIAAQGTVDQHPPVIWYREVRNPIHQTNDTAQLFLGTRINCAQCHHHPYEKWSQDDYYQFQAFFARMGRKSGETAAEPAIFVRPDGQVRNPATGKIMEPRGLDGPPITLTEDEDPRQKLVDWMVQPDNPLFAKAICNRIWAHFLGRGLVEPLDDMRVTNPPSNPELLDALAHDLIAHKFDLKQLIRQIMTSTTYQLSAEPTPQNIHDEQNYARAYPRRIIAEVILDGVSQVTGAQENFNGLPPGTRAIQLPDEAVTSYFLDVFGRPLRDTPCECERPKEANLAQALHMLNSVDMQNKIGAGQGRIAALLKEKQPAEAILEDLYLAAYGRLPKATERAQVLGYVAQQKNPRAAWEDLVWAMLNSKEFLFNH
jgi:uncharacterized protein DUF1549/uncharacterized protein DUF1553/Big-like domain-containing protein